MIRALVRQFRRKALLEISQLSTIMSTVTAYRVTLYLGYISCFACAQIFVVARHALFM